MIEDYEYLCGPNAFECAINGVHYAWDENDYVYVYAQRNSDDHNDDGFRYIGTLVPDDDIWTDSDLVRYLTEFAKNNKDKIEAAIGRKIHFDTNNIKT